MNSHCLYCGKRLGFFHSKEKPFCSEVHEDRYLEKEAKDGLSRLLEEFDPPAAPPPLEGLPRPLPALLPANAPVPLPVPLQVIAEAEDPPMVSHCFPDLGSLSLGIPPTGPGREPGLAAMENMIPSEALLPAGQSVVSLTAAGIGLLPVELPKAEPVLIAEPMPVAEMETVVALKGVAALEPGGLMKLVPELSSNLAQNGYRGRVSEPCEGAAAPFALKPVPEPIAEPRPPALFATTIRMRMGNPLPLIDCPAPRNFCEPSIAWMYPQQVIPATPARALPILPQQVIAVAPPPEPVESGPDGREPEALPRPEPVRLRTQRDAGALLPVPSKAHTLRQSRVSMPWKPVGLGFFHWQTQPQFGKPPLSLPEPACSPRA